MKRISIAILLISTLEVFGQADYNPFVFFQLEQSFRSFPILNPASIAATKTILLNTGGQLNGRPFQNSRKYYLQSSLPLSFMRKSYSHGYLGLVFQGEQEGLLLSRARWNLQYAWSADITPEWSLAFGASLGQLGYFVEATPVSQGGSSNILDGHVGAWAFSESMYFGLSSNQIFEGELVPIQQAFTISRLYHFIGGRKFDLTSNFRLHSACTVLIDPKFDDQYDVTFLGTFSDVLTAGAVMRFGRTLVMIAGLEHIDVGFFNDFSATFSYSFPVGTYAPDVRVFGVDLIFEIDWVTFPKTNG